MVNVRLASVLDTKVINNESERDRVGDVAEEASKERSLVASGNRLWIGER